MAQILKFPAKSSKLGYSRVKTRAKAAENPNQLELFARPTATILNFVPDRSAFETALMLDERNDAKAAELYRKAIEEQDCVADAYCNLGIIESQKGNTTKAFDCFTNSLKHNPRHSEAHYNLANVYFELNDFGLAKAHYEMACEVDPAFANGYFNLALILSINKDFAGAISALTKYQSLVSEAEARHADELLRSLRNQASRSENTRCGLL
jgi:tetratricopeptide (TPR) repeat protein